MTEIKFIELTCCRCGGQLKTVNDNTYQCISCGKTFEKQMVTDVADQLRAVLNEQKQEAVANLRRQLWSEMHEENINSEKVRSLARDIKKYLPEDYFANFCEIANSEVENNSKQINAFLNKTSQANIEDYADIVLDFMIKSLRTENITVVAQFIERAYKGRDNDSNYDKYTTWLESEADKIDKGIYDLDLPRDVFLAYSSADMDKVLEICDFLESNDITCFMALRNLRHGRNAIHNYDQALKTAIDHCKTIVFVSSTNSRNRKCDAFTKELPYIRQKDLEVAPAKYRHDYEKLPAEYMMPRVEYVIEDYRGNVAEKITKEFFHDLEWCKSKEAVADRIMNYLIGAPEPVEEETEEDIPVVEIPVKEDKSVKYCKKCGTKNRLGAKFCSKCKGTEFAETYDEYLASKIKFCALCGTQCDSEANVCDNCGSEMFVPTKKAYEDLIAQMAEEERQQKIREEQERLRREAEERKRQEEERKRKEEAERLRKVREEQERLRREEEERQRKIREEQERKRNEEAERLRKVREEQERLRREEEERQRREEVDLQRKNNDDQERKRKEEAERYRKELEEQARKRNEEAERIRKARAEQGSNGRDEAERIRIAREAQERLRREEEERQRKIREEEERQLKQEAEKNLKELPTLGDYKVIGNGYITFGTYPQSKKSSNITIGEVYDKERGYYLGSDNCLYERYKDAYYKVKPIKWKVLSRGSEQFIVSDIIIDAHRYDGSSNNYANSGIRSWLNGEFYNKAFKQEQKNKIVTTNVDNSSASTGYGSNQYVCGNTNDKVFLLSRKEVEQYFTSNTARQKKGTDYAKARGLYVGSNGNSWWLLRSPYCGISHDAQDVHVDGSFGSDEVNDSDYGVLSAIKIKNVEEESKDRADRADAERKRREEAERQRVEGQRKIREEEERQLKQEAEKNLKELPTLGDYKVIGNGYITFGTYPQSKKSSNITIGEVYDKERGYYLGSDNCLYERYKDAYYKVEPIKWKVLSRGSEQFIVSDIIIDAHRFDGSSNNYVNSGIRSWLNGEFYNKAFKQEQKNKIVITNVDNSLASTGDRKNKYKCKNTNDKVFLLSYKEAEQYFNSKSARQKMGTDYAKARNLSVANDGHSWWWLRSPYYDSNVGIYTQYVGLGGDFWNRNVNRDDYGVLCAIKIKNVEEEIKDRTDRADAERKRREEAERQRVEGQRKVREEEKEARQRYINDEFDIQNGVLVKYKGNGGNVVIPNGVTSIGERAFEHCESLKSLTIPNGVISIGAYAFYWCKSLTSINIPNSVTALGHCAFFLCESLKSITVPNSITSIGNSAFSCCKSLTSIIIPNSITSIGNGVFNGCTSLTSINIPNSVISIDNSAFQNCKSLTSITIPNGVTSIGELTFYGCISLKSITIPSSVTSIGKEAFYNCGLLKSVIIPYRVTSIGESAFSYCNSLINIIIPDGVTSIGKDAFSSCFKLKTIYCRAKKPVFGLPKGWDSSWLGEGKSKCKAQVVWNYKGNQVK